MNASLLDDVVAAIRDEMDYMPTSVDPYFAGESTNRPMPLVRCLPVYPAGVGVLV